MTWIIIIITGLLIQKERDWSYIYFLNAKLQSHINVSTVMVAIFLEMVSSDFDINMMIIFSCQSHM
jgi:hypothetical protein